MTRDVAIGHWQLPADGGGERVAWELARAYDAPVYTTLTNPEITPPDITVHSILNDRPTLTRLIKSPLPGLRQVGLVYAWQTAYDLHDYDTIITSGNEPLFYVPRDGQTWLHYAHHTGRLATDRIHKLEDWHTGLRGTLTKPFDYALKYAQRTTCSIEARKPDHIITNSELIMDRVHTFWGVPLHDLSTIYPPVDTHNLDPGNAPTGDYYLTLGRVEPAKGIDLMLDAFQDLDPDVSLRVAGTGSALDRLQDHAPENVSFLGYVPESEKRRLLAGAKGFIMAAENEDFGISPIEALASGTPVIGVNEGYTQHQVHNGKNGYLVPRTTQGIRDGVQDLEHHGITWTPKKIASNAERYSIPRFQEEITSLVDDIHLEKTRRRTPRVSQNGTTPEDAEPAVADGSGTEGEAQ